MKIKNLMFKRYFLNWCFRLSIFLVVLWHYIFNKEAMMRFVEFKLFDTFTPLHILWAVLMLSMILHIWPGKTLTMGARKSVAETYTEPKCSYDRAELLEYVQKMNIRAWKVMLVWLSFNAIFGVLYLFSVIGEAELILLSMFYFVCDTTCIVMFCPFQTFIMKNRCCVNCRIFDWGHFMIFTPMLFIRSFFTWSLFFTSLIVLIRWEVLYASHPERYWDGSNASIRCENCQDRLCRIKRPLRQAVEKKVETRD